jgi:hypothetical protein
MTCQISPILYKARLCIVLAFIICSQNFLPFVWILIVMNYYCTLDASRSLTEHLNDQYHHYMLQAEIFHEALNCLPFPGTYNQMFS